MVAQSKGLAIAALVCGLLFWFPWIGGLLSIAAIVLGIIALRRIKASPKQYGGKGMAIAGLVLGIIGLILWITVIVFMGVFLATILKGSTLTPPIA